MNSSLEPKQRHIRNQVRPFGHKAGQIQELLSSIPNNMAVTPVALRVEYIPS
jgi:hypothetical protein